MRRLLFIAILFAQEMSRGVSAHDTWVQTNTNIVRSGDVVHVDLMLGNHGNDHREFKLAGKTSLAGTTLNVVAPDGKVHDLKERLVDVGSSANEGFWSARHVARDPGLYVVAHQRDAIVNHGGKVRSIKSGKAFFVASKSLDTVSTDNPGFDRELGHPLEIIPDGNPVTPMEIDVPILIKVLFKGQPLKNARVSFIPRGQTLAEKFDADYERTTNSNGRCSYVPKLGTYHLIVVRHTTEEKGTDYDSTSYSATLTVLVPEICSCNSE